jgi:aminoglycoside 3-N-acetyltransferase
VSIDASIFSRRAMIALVRKHISSDILRRLQNVMLERRRRKVRDGPPLSESTIEGIFREQLRVKRGGVLFVHNSIELINISCTPIRLLDILRNIVGPQGTLLFPTFPGLSGAEFLRRGCVFDVRRSPCFSGLLGELARRQPGAARSLHPIRSVAAVGQCASEITSSHHLSIYPFDITSPFGLLPAYEAQIVGVGISSKNLTFVHAVDDCLSNDHRSSVYLPGIFTARCMDKSGNPVSVRTKAHDVSKMTVDIPRYLEKHISPSIAKDLSIGNMRFFTAEARPLMDRMLTLALSGVTIYK